ncbi:hypothetical protein [Streptomyces sp. NPDC001851]|uniref:hypothetical protein n=1 Tax=Streptomyces sp. NPDC001851 TaxID=3154529 RepID=UPI003319905F
MAEDQFDDLLQHAFPLVKVVELHMIAPVRAPETGHSAFRRIRISAPARVPGGSPAQSRATFPGSHRATRDGGDHPRRETVPQTDDGLLAFDASDLEDWGEQRARAALGGRYGALYRNHRCIALHLDSRAEAEGRRTEVDAHDEAGYMRPDT